MARRQGGEKGGVMTLPGETILTGAPRRCDECGVTVEFKVCRSNAGYYVGTECNCGPYTRETVYFGDWDMAARILQLWDKGLYVERRL